MERLPPMQYNLVSDDLLCRLIGMRAQNNRVYWVTSWNHIIDACSRGTISPMEAYDAIILGYVPDHLLVRASRYQPWFTGGNVL